MSLWCRGTQHRTVVAAAAAALYPPAALVYNNSNILRDRIHIYRSIYRVHTRLQPVPIYNVIHIILVPHVRYILPDKNQIFII